MLTIDVYRYRFIDILYLVSVWLSEEYDGMFYWIDYVFDVIFVRHSSSVFDPIEFTIYAYSNIWRSFRVTINITYIEIICSNFSNDFPADVVPFYHGAPPLCFSFSVSYFKASDFLYIYWCYSTAFSQHFFFQ